jgi:DNA-binding CsgD family transcriptional regulator
MPITKLNTHELLLLDLLAAGKQLKQIHDIVNRENETDVSLSSIKYALTRIYAKLGVPNSNAAVAEYVTWKLTTCQTAQD